MTTPFRLYFFMQPGCPGCHAAEPALNKFKFKHSEGLVVPVNVRLRQEVAGVKAKVTPTYLMLPGIEKEGIIHEGPLDESGLEELLYEATTDPDDDDEDSVRRGHDDVDAEE